MLQRTNIPSKVDAQEEVDNVWSHQSIGKNPSSDRAIVLSFIDELVIAGLGVLEEVPGFGPQFLSLRSGEVFWLGADGVMRIK